MISHTAATTNEEGNHKLIQVIEKLSAAAHVFLHKLVSVLTCILCWQSEHH